MQLVSPSAARLLSLILKASRRGRAPSRARLAELSGLAPEQVTLALAELASQGLLDASRLRLTLAGLAVASALCARAPAAKLRLAREDRRRAAPSVLTIALFAGRELPRAVA